jgi:parallel beta-helix repeat protein
MSNRIRSTVPGLAVALAVAALAPALAPVAADEGRIPIWTRTVIAQDGKYVVTRDLPPGGGPAIEIAPGVEHVDIDVNGFTLSGDPGGGPVILAPGFHRSVTIRNGEIRAQGPPGAGIDLSEVEKVVLEDLKVVDAQDAGILLRDVANFALRRNIVVAANLDGIVVDNSGAGTVAHGSIEDNVVRDCGAGITVLVGASVGVANNRVEATFSGSGILLENVASALLTSNTVKDTADMGIFLAGVTASKIHNNLIHRAGVDGIYVDGACGDNLFLDNVSSGNNGNGLVVEGKQNQFDRNVINTNGLGGIYLRVGASGNTFGRNTVRGNGALPGVCVNPATACLAPDYCEDNAAPSGNVSFNDNFAPVGC